MRGQVSLEFFLLLGIALIVILWLTNYYNFSRESSINASFAEQQKIVGAELARASNLAYIDGLSVELSAPCPKIEDKKNPILVSHNQSYLFLFSSASNISIQTVSNFSFDDFVLDCTYKTLCVKKVADAVDITFGGC